MCKWCLMISFTHRRLCVNDALWFHLHIVDLPNAIWRVFFCYKDIRRKAFFTMATLLMLLLENEYFLIQATFGQSNLCQIISLCTVHDERARSWTKFRSAVHIGFLWLKSTKNKVTWSNFMNFSKQVSVDSHNFCFRLFHSL